MPKLCFKTTRTIDHVATGKVMRSYRERRNVTMNQVVNIMPYRSVTQSKLSRLESGQIQWNQELFDQIVHAIDTVYAGDIPPN